MAHEFQPLPRSTTLTVLALTAATALSAAAIIPVAGLLAEKPLWLVMGFELVVLITGVLGVLFARGRFQEGQGLTLLCIAATIAIATSLAWLSIQGRLQLRGREAPIDVQIWWLARIAVALILVILAAFSVLRRNPNSMAFLWRAAAFGAPLVVIGAAAVALRSKLGSLTALPGWALMGTLSIGGIAVIILLSGLGHCLIRAFEFGRTPTRQ